MLECHKVLNFSAVRQMNLTINNHCDALIFALTFLCYFWKAASHGSIVSSDCQEWSF